MADRTRIDAAFAELGAAINAFIQQREEPPPPPPAEPYAKFTNFPPFRVQEATLVVETNVQGLEYVLFAENQHHTWYEDTRKPLPAGGTFTVKARADGDRVKVFGHGINADSLPFKFEEAPVEPVPGGASAQVNKFLDGMPGGLNVEREIWNELSQGEWDYLYKQVPAPVVRGFLAWRPEDGIFAGNGGRAWALPSPAFVASFVEGAVRAQKAGFKRALVDCSDVCTDNSFTGEGVKLIQQACEMVANEVKRRGLSPDFLAIGPVNEWATSQQNVHRYQQQFIDAIERILPNHVYIFGCDYWKYWGKLIENTSFQPPRQERAFCDTHSYTTMDEGGWRWLAGELSKWQQRTKRRVVYGEAGLGSLQRDEQNYNVYPGNARLMLPIMRPFCPLPWSVNKGGHWKLNWNGAELVNKQRYENGGHAPDIADALREGLGV